MRLAITSALLFGLWLLLSGSADPFYLVVGVAASVAVAATTDAHGDATRFRPLRFLAFLPWLAWQVIRSNLRLARLVLSRRMPVNPTFISQKPGVSGDRALTTLGAGITLTPGTLTVDVADGELFVHALDAQSARDVRAGIMARRVALAFTGAGREPSE